MARIAGLLFLLACLPSATAGTFVVDASGGGDFLGIQQALDVASPGDVLLVQPGSYAAFDVVVPVTILGAPSAYPSAAGLCSVRVGGTTIAGLSVGRLDVLDARGTVLIDDVRVLGQLPGPTGCEGMQIRDSGPVHLTRCTILGKDGDAFCESRGLRVVDSEVTLTGSLVEGGTGWGDDFIGYPGQVGLDVAGASSVMLAQTSVIGGDGGTPEILFGGQGGQGAEALRVDFLGSGAGTTVIVRGHGGAVLQGGSGGLGIGGADAFSAATGHGTLVVSGVSVQPAAYGAALDVQQPDPAQPFLHMIGNDEAGSFKRMNLYGPAGTTLVVMAGFASARLDLFAVDGVLYLDPSSTGLFVPVVLLGPDLSENLTFQLPASLEGLHGLRLVIQGAAPGLGEGGTYLATNPEHLLLR